MITIVFTQTSKRGRPRKTRQEEEEEEEEEDSDAGGKKKGRGRKRGSDKAGKKGKVPTLKIKLGKRKKDSSVSVVF